jgi:hypothetical protein
MARAAITTMGITTAMAMMAPVERLEEAVSVTGWAMDEEEVWEALGDDPVIKAAPADVVVVSAVVVDEETSRSVAWCTIATP